MQVFRPRLVGVAGAVDERLGEVLVGGHRPFLLAFLGVEQRLAAQDQGRDLVAAGQDRQLASVGLERRIWRDLLHDGYAGHTLGLEGWGTWRVSNIWRIQAGFTVYRQRDRKSTRLNSSH